MAPKWPTTFELRDVVKEYWRGRSTLPTVVVGDYYYRYGIDIFDIWIQYHSIDIGNETQKILLQLMCKESEEY